MATFEIQKQIRENSLEMSEFLTDLNDWTSKVEKKDDALKKGMLPSTGQKKEVPSTPAPRGRVKNTASAPESTPGGSQPYQAPPSTDWAKKKKKKVKAKQAEKDAQNAANKAGHTYDYFRDKWDKFDIDAALNEVDEESSEDEKEEEKPKEEPVLRGPGDIAKGQTFVQPALAEKEKEDPEKLKNKGNELFKKADYGGAISYYSKSIDAEPTAVAYANRAMALLKQGKYAEAEADCSVAIDMDAVYVKAYSRRGTARRHLQRLLESTQDFEMAVRLEPNSKAHAQERLASQGLFEAGEKLNVTAPRVLVPVVSVSAPPPPPPEEHAPAEAPAAAPDTPSGRRPAGEGAAPPEDSAEGTSQGGGEAAAGPAAEAGEAAEEQRKARPPGMEVGEGAFAQLEARQRERIAAQGHKAPASGIEFEKTWKTVAKDPGAQIQYLQVLEPSSLAAVFKSSLTAEILVNIVRTCLAALEEAAAAEHMLALLEGLPTVPRFDMTAMFLGGKIKKELQPRWEALISKLEPAASARMTALKKKYKL